MHAGPAVIPFGGPVGIPELDAKVNAGIELRIGKATTALERVASLLGRATMLPRYLSNAGQATADTNGFALIQLGSVPQGMRWVVHQVVVGGLTWGTSAPGSAVVAILPNAPTTDLALPTIAVQDEASSLPNVAFYSRGQFVVPSLSSIWVQVTGGTSGQVYVASCDFVSETAGS